MIHRDINVFNTLTSEYTYTHTSLDNVSTTVGTYRHSGYTKMSPV